MLADNCSRVPNESTVYVGMPHCWNHVVYIVVVNHQNAYIPRAHTREMDQCICIGHMFNRMVVESGSMGSGGGKGAVLDKVSLWNTSLTHLMECYRLSAEN